MEPFGAAAVVIATVCAIVGAVSSAQQIYDRRKRRKNEKNGVVEDQPPAAAVDIMLRINYLVSKFGRRFEERVKLDKTVLHEVRRLQPQLETVLAKVAKLQKESASSPSGEDEEVDELAAKLWRQVNELKSDIEEVLI
ncbi:hypothetical protein N658DRAFT_81699 [Parathielavia hyrcaniae]|uniref:Uncharacterized protein n=1 Tax=Parathielavia hyrcaniae TaxID=113614 RepID=A0AAN6SWX8_9PEZI|nr:hypothetical protein N658DRAFT_81699 [Parathielavia hyrcaniae]